MIYWSENRRLEITFIVFVIDSESNSKRPSIPRIVDDFLKFESRKCALITKSLVFETLSDSSREMDNHFAAYISC